MGSCRWRRRLVQPSTRLVPDYHTWVPKASTMILPDILKKARGGRYLSLEQFRCGGGGRRPPQAQLGAAVEAGSQDVLRSSSRLHGLRPALHQPKPSEEDCPPPDQASLPARLPALPAGPTSGRSTATLWRTTRRGKASLATRVRVLRQAGHSAAQCSAAVIRPMQLLSIDFIHSALLSALHARASALLQIS